MNPTIRCTQSTKQTYSKGECISTYTDFFSIIDEVLLFLTYFRVLWRIKIKRVLEILVQVYSDSYFVPFFWTCFQTKFVWLIDRNGFSFFCNALSELLAPIICPSKNHANRCFIGPNSFGGRAFDQMPVEKITRSKFHLVIQAK